MDIGDIKPRNGKQSRMEVLELGVSFVRYRILLLATSISPFPK